MIVRTCLWHGQPSLRLRRRARCLMGLRLSCARQTRGAFLHVRARVASCLRRCAAPSLGGPRPLTTHLRCASRDPQGERRGPPEAAEAAHARGPRADRQASARARGREGTARSAQAATSGCNAADICGSVRSREASQARRAFGAAAVAAATVAVAAAAAAKAKANAAAAAKANAAASAAERIEVCVAKRFL